MKRTIRILSLVLLFSLCLGLTAAHADELWSEQYYRAYDHSGELTDEDRDDLDSTCISIMKRHGCDVALLSATAEDYEGGTMEQLAQAYYEQLGYGYGEAKDCFFVVCDAAAGTAAVVPFGGAEGRLDEETLRMIEEDVPTFYEEDGVYGMLYAAAYYLDSAMTDAEGETDGGSEGAVNTVGATDGFPAWYPDDPKNFTFFHDPTAPRVVDLADIFTPAEEERMEARLAAIRKELDRDIVIYTDVTDYGMGKDIWAADFYDFNGYGCGSEREGVCLFIDMDPDNRGWWACCTGSDTMGLYTEDVANAIDDRLYEYMASGADYYAAGVERWIEDFRTLYKKGVAPAPDWYPDRGETRSAPLNVNAPRVVDELGLLTDEQVAALTAKAQTISEKYGTDVVILLSEPPLGVSRSAAASTFYGVRGYGADEERSGFLLAIFKREGYYATDVIQSYGAETISEVNLERMSSHCESKTDDKNYYEACEQWLRELEHMKKTGRVPQSVGSWLLTVLGSILGGSAVGGISLGKAKLGMRVPQLQKNADAYLVAGTMQIRNAGDTLLNTTTSRRYAPITRSSSGGGGGSSYSSSYSGSSGSSHSGSGRSF